MTRQEFTDRTNYTPSWSEFEKIHNNYMEFKGDKDQFCRLWKKLNKSTINEQEFTKKRIEFLTMLMDNERAMSEAAASIGDWRMEDFHYRELQNYKEQIELKEKSLYRY